MWALLSCGDSLTEPANEHNRGGDGHGLTCTAADSTAHNAGAPGPPALERFLLRMLLLVPRQGCGLKFGGADVALQEVQVRRRLLARQPPLLVPQLRSTVVAAAVRSCPHPIQPPGCLPAPSCHLQIHPLPLFAATSRVKQRVETGVRGWRVSARRVWAKVAANRNDAANSSKNGWVVNLVLPPRPSEFACWP